ncbi:E3 ubiquitin-protein ligase RSL1-like [Magnolia sinica]|uniref:E3 ubiquitin-protein ligase RSL1-like n=1 Tax=Magnolia sinica TaxID=86752 RepID=UPI0026582988|nr:E3 ubiquitin-protein ligase RSL1-like [Magnolia sinica]
MGESSNSNTLAEVVDDFYVALLKDEDLIPISDEKFAEELQLQEAIFSSILSHRRRPSLETAIEPSSKKRKTTPTKSDTYITKTGESSGSFCDICAELKSPLEMFVNKNCSHVFCNDCISKHVGVKIQESIAMVICPGLKCKGVLEPHLCRSIIPTQVFERWEAALSESLVLGSQKFYCPFKDCSVLLIDDGDDVVTQSECPNCRRLFCAQCKVAWHSGIGCEEYKRLNEDEKGRDDLLVMELAKSKKWKRCSRCKFYVEKTEGCVHMTCRCGFQFCYRCGSTWLSTHSCELQHDRDNEEGGRW